MIKMENSNLIQQRNEYLRKSEDNDLSKEEREKYANLTDEMTQKIELLVKDKLHKEGVVSEKGVKMENENIGSAEGDARTPTKKYKTIKEHVSDVRDNAEEAILAYSGGDLKVAVSLCQNILGKLREDKKKQNIEEETKDVEN